MGKTTLESGFGMTLEAERLGCIHQARRSPVNRNLMAKHTHLIFGQQALHFRGHHPFMTVGARLAG
jgi:hypothetical protein